MSEVEAPATNAPASDAGVAPRRAATLSERMPSRTTPLAHGRGSWSSAQPGADMPRLARYVVTRGWIHLVLLTGVGIFLFPFVWMVGTSMKTDEELTAPGWMPSVPRFVASSPYVLPAPEPLKPMAVDSDVWERVLPRLIRAARERVEAVRRARPPGDAFDPVAHRDAAAAVVLNRTVTRLNTNVWAGSDDEIVAALATEMTDEIVGAALVDRLARLELRGLLLRTIDAHIFPLADGPDTEGRWQVESGRAKVVAGGDGASYLRYAFDSTSAPPIVLRFDFDFPADPADLHKIILSYKADSSWHRVDSTLDVGGQRWVGTRPTYLSQTRPASILLQPPTFEDETFKNRLWTPLELVSSAPTDAPRRATLRLTISPSSTLEAIAAKVQANYARAFRAVPFWRYVGNSLLLVTLTTAGVLFSSTFVAYAFARLNWPGRTVAFVLLLSTMMLPGQVTMIPSFVIWRNLGWYNTLNPLWVPAFFGVAFFVFLMTQHMRTIPRELEEAARIDGLNAVQTWWYIIVPLVKPAAAAIAIMTVMAAWNEFMGPLIYLRDQSKFPLSLGLFGIRIDAGADWTLIMAGNVLMTLPVVVMFIVFQKYFVQGMTMSGMKA